VTETARFTGRKSLPGMPSGEAFLMRIAHNALITLRGLPRPWGDEKPIGEEVRRC